MFGFGSKINYFKQEEFMHLLVTDKDKIIELVSQGYSLKKYKNSTKPIIEDVLSNIFDSQDTSMLAFLVEQGLPLGNHSDILKNFHTSFTLILCIVRKINLLESIIKSLGILIDAGLNIDEPLDLEGNTLLHLICANSSNDAEQALNEILYQGASIMGKALIKLGANVNIKNDSGTPPILYAIYNKNNIIVKEICKHGFDLTIHDDKNLLLYSTMHGTVEITKSICQVYTNIKGDIKWFQAAYVATQNRNTLCLTTILDFCPNINMVGGEGITLLHYASSENYSMAIKALVQRGADLNIKTSDGKTALDYAQESNSKEASALILRLLQEKAASITK